MENKLIVVVGAAGRLGRLVTREIVERGARVRALVRDPSKPEVAALAGDRVELVAFDAVTASDAERAAAVAGAYAVVSTLQGGPEVIIQAQLALVHAAKAAGVRRFLPSDFSVDFFGLPAGMNVGADMRRALAGMAASTIGDGFEVVHVLNGMFLDGGVLRFLGLFDPEAAVMRYWGDGKTPFEVTTWEDTAAFAAAAALDDRPVPARLGVAGARLDIFALAKAWQAHHGRTLTLERLGSLSDLEAEIARRRAAEPTNLYAWLPLMYARAVFGGEGLHPELHNARYPEITVEPLASAIARGAI